MCIIAGRTLPSPRTQLAAACTHVAIATAARAVTVGRVTKPPARRRARLQRLTCCTCCPSRAASALVLLVPLWYRRRAARATRPSCSSWTATPRSWGSRWAGLSMGFGVFGVSGCFRRGDAQVMAFQAGARDGGKGGGVRVGCARSTYVRNSVAPPPFPPRTHHYHHHHKHRHTESAPSNPNPLLLAHAGIDTPRGHHLQAYRLSAAARPTAPCTTLKP